MLRHVKLFLLLLLVAPLFSFQSGMDEDGQEDGWMDVRVQHLFEKAHIGSLVEFGMGKATEYFLTHCDQVSSIEILLPDQSSSHIEQTAQGLKKYTHWQPILKQGTKRMARANLLAARDKKDPALYDAFYTLELKDICDEFFRDNEATVAWVDPSFHMRGDLVNELFDRVPVIIAPSTEYRYSEYGWWKIQMPSNYQKFHFSEGNGITVWVRRDQTDIIEAMGGTPPLQEPARKNLRIFFPGMHHTLIKSMVLTFQYLGHTLVLPGYSFDPERADPGPKLPGSLYYSRDRLRSDLFYSDLLPFLQDGSSPPVLEIMENDAFLKDPPDILVVNWEGVETAIYDLYGQLQKWTGNTGIKLVHYAGNNNTVYKNEAVKNLIAVDAYTAKNHDPFKTNILFWIPWLDSESLSFEGYGDRLRINNFLDRYYRGAFKYSGSLFQVVEEFVKARFPEVEIHSPLFCPPREVFSLIDDSCATFHIKESEGFGYTIVESISKGRPVFLYRPFSLGSRLMNWAIEGKTAFFFYTLAELEEKMRPYLEDQEYRHQVQEECARTVRRLIDNEKQARILDRFLQNLI